MCVLYIPRTECFFGAVLVDDRKGLHLGKLVKAVETANIAAGVARFSPGDLDGVKNNLVGTCVT